MSWFSNELFRQNCKGLNIKMQVGVPSGKNTAKFRGDEGESILNTNILLHGKIWMGLDAFKTVYIYIETGYKIEPTQHRIRKL